MEAVSLFLFLQVREGRGMMISMLQCCHCEPQSGVAIQYEMVQAPWRTFKRLPKRRLDCRVGTASLLAMTGEKEGVLAMTGEKAGPPRDDREGTGWAWDSLGKDEF